MNSPRIWLSFFTALFHSLRSHALHAACDRLASANRYARKAPEGQRHYIYALKTLFVRLLYESGYCTALRKDVQTKPCWGPRWAGGCLGADCPKCDGDGIYSLTYLYAFTFVVDAQEYFWHQPAWLVNYPVRLTEEGREFATPIAHTYTQLSDDDLLASLWPVWFALAWRGRRPPFLLIPPYVSITSHRRDICVFGLYLVASGHEFGVGFPVRLEINQTWKWSYTQPKFAVCWRPRGGSFILLGGHNAIAHLREALKLPQPVGSYCNECSVGHDDIPF